MALAIWAPERGNPEFEENQVEPVRRKRLRV